MFATYLEEQSVLKMGWGSLKQKEDNHNIDIVRVSEFLQLCQAHSDWYEKVQSENVVYAPCPKDSTLYQVFNKIATQHLLLPKKEGVAQVRTVNLDLKLPWDKAGTSQLIQKEGRIFITSRPKRKPYISTNVTPLTNEQRELFFQDAKKAQSFDGHNYALKMSDSSYQRWANFMFNVYLKRCEELHCYEEK